MSESGEKKSHAETEHKSESTTASNTFLHKKENKLKRWFGHGVRLVGTELAITWGTGLATFGVLGSILSGGALTPLALAGLGSALAATGAAAEWNIGMKNAKSETEKSTFWLSKLGQMVGNPALTILSGGSYPAVATGMAVAGAAMGARSMAHRK